MNPKIKEDTEIKEFTENDEPIRTGTMAQSISKEFYYEKIREADARLERIAVTWDVTERRFADTHYDTKKSEALAKEKIRTSTGTQLDKDVLRNVLQEAASDRTWRKQITFLSDGTTVRAEVISRKINPTDVPAHVLDIFDGQNVIYATGVGEQMPTFGTVTRDMKMRLSFSAPGFIRPILLYGDPLAKVFPPESTTVTDIGDSILLERDLPYDVPILTQVKISKSHWHPTEITMRNVHNKKIHSHYFITDYKQYEGDVWLPAHIREDRTNEAGTALGYSEYKLERIHLNEKVDIRPLAPPVPRGTNLSDFRFGKEHGVGYRVTTFIPSDERVQEMLKQEEEQKKQRDLTAKRQDFAGLLSSGGLSCATIGLVKKWRRNHTK